MKRRFRGFGLVELMVSIVIGLIVLAGITSLVVATMRANTENLGMTRLTQDMRATVQLVTRDLRRAGYSQEALLDFGTGAQDNNAFTNVRVFDSGGNQLVLTDGIDPPGGSCITFSYDIRGANPGDPPDGIDQDVEHRGFRLNQATNQIEAKVSGSSDTDCENGVWEELTDAETLLVDRFEITTRDGASVPEFRGLVVRELLIAMEATLAGDETVTRTITESVRVRNDLLN